MSGSSARWSRYRPDRQPRGEDGRPQEGTSDPAPTSDRPVADSGLSVAGILVGALVLVGLVMVPLGIAVVLTSDDSEDAGAAESASSPATPAPPPEPLDLAQVTRVLDQFSSAPETRGKQATYLHLSPDSAAVDLYDAGTGQTMKLSSSTFEAGYRVRVSPDEPAPDPEELFDLDQVRPRVLVEVSEEALQRASAPASYGLLVNYRHTSEEVAISAVVHQTDETALIVRTDLTGKVLEESVVNGD